MYNGNQGGLDIRTASNYIVLSDGDGNPRQIIDGSGNAGVGVTPNTSNLGGTYKLLSVGTSGGSGIFMGQSDSTASGSTVAQFLGKTTGTAGYQLVGGMIVATDGTSTTNAVGRLQFYTASGGALNEAMRIDSSGNVGIGTTSPTSNLTVNGSASAEVDYNVANTKTVLSYADATQYITGTVTSIPYIFRTANTEKMRITSGGQVCVNATSGAGVLSVVGNVSYAAMYAQAYANGDYGLGFKNASGTTVAGIVINSGSVAYNTTSDYRLKENVAPMTSALQKVAQLKPVTYTWSEEFGGGNGQGFIAHELQAVVPDCVTGEKDAVDEDGNPKYQGVDTSFLVATLTAAIQEQQALIESLTTRLTALENK
jgi:hypothetical protein